MPLDLRAQPLTRTAFAPYGDVIETAGATHYAINAGTTERFHDLATIDVLADGGRPLFNIFRADPITENPFALRLMERHTSGSQAFYPVGDTRFLLVVAPPGDFERERMTAFVANAGQGVNYARGTWHHPLLALTRISDFVVIDRGADAADCEEITLTDVRLHY